MMQHTSAWKTWVTRSILLLWGFQIIWLGYYFAPEMQDLAWRLAKGNVGAAIRQEDPLYRWLQAIASLIPENATYVFLDNYEAGKEIEARYFLAPRRHILVAPETPADFLFHSIHQEDASFVLVRDRDAPLGSGFQAAMKSPAFQTVDLPGPGLVLRVDPALLPWGFHD